MKALMCLHRHDHQQNHQNPKVKLQSQSRRKNQKRYRKFIIYILQLIIGSTLDFPMNKLLNPPLRPKKRIAKNQFEKRI